MSHHPSHWHPKPTALALAALIAAGLSAPVGAELARVGPVISAVGYPQWYQDSTGLALDLCMPDAVDLAAGNCLLLPQDVPNRTAPETFPTNFADEHFWFAVDAAAPIGGNATASLVLAVEAAFGGGPPKQGDQIAFGRIRVKIDPVPANGTYTVIHPYGTLTFPDQVAGGRIFYTDDVGINCAPGDFSCAMKTSIGPFLRAAATPGGDALPFVTINGKTMLADPANPTPVTGSPFKDNVFRIIGPNGTVLGETEVFNLMGRVYTAPIPSPLRGERAGYTRNASGAAWVDVFASATAGIGQAAPNLGLSGAGLVPQLMTQEGQTGRFWGQANVSGAVVPSEVQVTNNGDVPPSVVKVAVHDVVTVTEAIYDPKLKTLTVKAKSSDEGAAPPELVLPAHGGVVVNNVTGGVVNNLTAPPKEVTVQSSAQGADTAPVTIAQAAPVSVVLTDVSVIGNEDTAMEVRVGPDNPSGTYRMLTQPVHGQLRVNPANPSLYTYTPNTNYEGTDSFTYVINVNGSDSSIATVALTVRPVNDPPVANADSIVTTQGRTATVNLLANDIDPDLTTGINPATVTIVTPPAQGTVSVSDGVATYTPAGTGPFSFSFSYTVADKAGAVSNPATVSVSVAGAESLAVTTAEYRTDKQRWKISGTSSVQAGQTVTVRPRNSTSGATGNVIGTAVVGAGGAWAVDVVGSSVSGAGFNQVQATSPLGGSGNGTLRLK